MANFYGIDFEKLWRLLPDFYHDYVNDEQFIKTFYEALIEVENHFNNNVEQVANNAIISQTEMYRNIAFFTIKAKQGLYDIQEIKNEHANWDDLNIADKVSILDEKEYYEKLSAKRDWDISEPNIVSLDLYQDFNRNNQLQYFQDFFLKDNKLYLLGKSAIPITQEGNAIPKKLYAYNIFVDYNTLYKKWGEKFRFLPSPHFSIGEYRQILISLLISYMGGPLIKNIEHAIKSISGWEDFKLYDEYNAGEDKKWLWSTGYLKPFDFVLGYNIDNHLFDTEKTKYIRDMLFNIKPSYTKFHTINDKVFIDSMELESLVSLSYTKIVSIEESMELKDALIVRTDQKYEQTEGLDKVYYDNDHKFDDGHSFDTISLRDIPVLKLTKGEDIEFYFLGPQFPAIIEDD